MHLEKINMKLTDWIVDEDGISVYRAIKGLNANDSDNRIAFIEKSPRVKIPRFSLCIETFNEVGCTGLSSEKSAWLYGDKGSDCFDGESREWCDKMLVLLGYELE